MSFAIVANQSNITIVSTVDTVGYRAKDLINAAALVSDVQQARIGALAKWAEMVIAGSFRSEASPVARVRPLPAHFGVGLHRTPLEGGLGGQR